MHLISGGKYAKNIRKIDQVLGIRIETIYKSKTRGKLSIRPFFYPTILSFAFSKHFEGFRRPSKDGPFKSP